MTSPRIPALLPSQLPIVAAPMAGGPSTVALAAAVSEAGGFPFLAAGYKTVAAMTGEVAQLRQSTDSFGVNVFVPNGLSVDPAAYAAYRETLLPLAEELGASLPETPVEDDDCYADKLDALVSDSVPVVSFTFGIPGAADVRRLQRAGSTVLATVTHVDELTAAEEAGVDGVVVQGPRAGAHSGTSQPTRPLVDRPTSGLVAELRAVSTLPFVAAGGVDGPNGVATLLAAGAQAVAVGTLLLRTDECGASQVQKDALADPELRETVMTHCFTGRPARALRNAFVDRYAAAAPFGYPALHHLTRDLRRAATRQGRQQDVNLWAGTGYRSARPGPAGDVIRGLAGAL
ncbi:MAG: nitronate monooxygenase [Actinomycetales bacterium]